jgi:hypothetical protein
MENTDIYRLKRTKLRCGHRETVEPVIELRDRNRPYGLGEFESSRVSTKEITEGLTHIETGRLATSNFIVSYCSSSGKQHETHFRAQVLN